MPRTRLPIFTTDSPHLAIRAVVTKIEYICFSRPKMTKPIVESVKLFNSPRNAELYLENCNISFVVIKLTFLLHSDAALFTTKP